MRKFLIILMFCFLIGQSSVHSQQENKLLDCVPQHILNSIDHMKYFASDGTYLGYTRDENLLAELKNANANDVWTGYLDENQDGIYEIWEVSDAPEDTEYYGHIILNQFAPNQYSHRSSYPIYFWKSENSFFVIPFGISISEALGNSTESDIHPILCRLYQIELNDLQSNYNHFEHRMSIESTLDGYYTE